MKTLFAVLLGIILGILLWSTTYKPYTTSEESNVRLYEKVFIV